MANAIDLVLKYLPILDEQYKLESRSAILDTPPAFIRETAEANKFKIAKITTQGLANYSRGTGFVDGDETLTWEEYTYPWDRGRSFQVDNMDNLESMALAFGRLAGNFNRMHVIPEIDAARFALYASKAGTKVTTKPTEATILDMFDDALEKMDDAEVPEEGRICFLRPAISKMIQQSPDLTKSLDVDVSTSTVGGRSITTKVVSYNGMRLIKVPSTRFYDSIALTAGGAGGYTPTAETGKFLDFLIVHPSALFQDKKHEISRVWAPNRALAAGTDGVNPKADAWKFDYRLYHGAFTYSEKSSGIYSCASTLVSGG